MNLAQRLGFSKDAKLLIIHADDAGLSHSQNMATMLSLEKGLVNSYSIMMTCPWFYEMAVFAKSNPQYDYGVHLTLTCEWENYKFGPILPIAEVPSLVDSKGFFYPKRDDLKRHATIEDVKKELKAQIEQAFKFGLNPTHLDSHMYSVGVSPQIFKLYKDLGDEYGLPVLVSKQLMEMVGLNPIQNISSNEILVEKAHYGIYEYFEKGTLNDYYRDVFEDIETGFNIILIHPAFDNTEMKGITVNHPNFGSKWRQIDFDFFSNEEHLSKIIDHNIQLITWNDIKKVKREIFKNM